MDLNAWDAEDSCIGAAPMYGVPLSLLIGFARAAPSSVAHVLGLNAQRAIWRVNVGRGTSR